MGPVMSTRRLLAAVRRRIVRLVRKHGIEIEAEEGEGGEEIDPLFEEQPALASIQGASVLGRVVTGPRAGRWVVRLGPDPRADVVISGGQRQVHMRGFDLHADTAVGEGERHRLEWLCHCPAHRPSITRGARLQIWRRNLNTPNNFPVLTRGRTCGM